MNPDIVREYVVIVWHRRWFVFAATIGAFVLAAIAELTIILPDYDAEVVLVRTAPELGGEKMAGLIPEAFHTKAYENLVTSTTVLGGVLEESIARGVWEDEGDIPDFEDFRPLLSTKTTIVDETTRPVNYAPMLTLIATGDTPERAKALVDIWAEKAIEAAKQANELAIGTATETLNTQEEEYRARLETVWSDLADEEALWNIEIMQTDLELKVSLLHDLELQKGESQKNLAMEEERLVSVRESLALEDEYKYLWRAPSDDVYWLEEFDRADGATPSVSALEELQGKGLVHQQINPLFISLKTIEREALLGVAGFRAAMESLSMQISKLDTERKALQKAIAEHSLEQKRLRRQADIYDRIYLEIADLKFFVIAAAEIVRPQDDALVLPVGFNRLSPQTYYREHGLVTSGKLRVGLVTAFAMMGAIGFLILRNRLPQFMQQTQDTSEAESKKS